MLDTAITAETPEGLLLELRPAGLVARAYAFLLDGMIRIAVLMAASAVLTVSGIGVGVWLVMVFAIEWLYPVVFELMPSGATPGKKAFGLKVVMDNGLPVTPAASFTRNLLRAADFLPFLYGFAVVSMLVRRDCKRLGDVAAATLVVHEPEPISRPTPVEVPPLAPALALSVEDQAALLALAARAPRLTGERLDELAALAAAVSGDRGRSGPDVTRRVLGVAQWILGRRP